MVGMRKILGVFEYFIGQIFPPGRGGTLPPGGEGERFFMKYFCIGFEKYSVAISSPKTKSES